MTLSSRTRSTMGAPSAQNTASRVLHIDPRHAVSMNSGVDTRSDADAIVDPSSQLRFSHMHTVTIDADGGWDIVCPEEDTPLISRMCLYTQPCDQCADTGVERRAPGDYVYIHGVPHFYGADHVWYRVDPDVCGLWWCANNETGASEWILDLYASQGAGKYAVECVLANEDLGTYVGDNPIRLDV